MVSENMPGGSGFEEVHRYPIRMEPATPLPKPPDKRGLLSQIKEIQWLLAIIIAGLIWAIANVAMPNLEARFVTKPEFNAVCERAEKTTAQIMADANTREKRLTRVEDNYDAIRKSLDKIEVNLARHIERSK
jgi:hypothetical protein